MGFLSNRREKREEESKKASVRLRVVKLFACIVEERKFELSKKLNGDADFSREKAEMLARDADDVDEVLKKLENYKSSDDYWDRYGSYIENMEDKYYTGLR